MSGDALSGCVELISAAALNRYWSETPPSLSTIRATYARGIITVNRSSNVFVYYRRSPADRCNMVVHRYAAHPAHVGPALLGVIIRQFFITDSWNEARNMISQFWHAGILSQWVQYCVRV